MDGFKKIIFKGQLYTREVFWIGKRFVPAGKYGYNIGTTFFDVYTADYPTTFGKLLGLKRQNSLFCREQELQIPCQKRWADLKNNEKVKDKKLESFLNSAGGILWKI